MNSSLKLQLDKLLTERIGPWAPESLLVTAELVNNITKVRTPCVLNLMDYMGKDSFIAKQLMSEPRLVVEGHRRPIIFPEFTDCEEATRKSLTGQLRRLCGMAGFILICSGWDKPRQRILFDCQRKRIHETANQAAKKEAKRAEMEALNKTFNEKSYTRRPIACDQRCKFGFQLTFRVERKCWTFETGSGSPNHTNHMKMNNGEIGFSARSLAADEQKLLEAAVASNAPPQATQALLANRYGVELSDSQIYYLATKARAGDDLSTPGQSAAEKLLEYLKANKSVSYVAMYDNSIDSALLSVVNKGRPRKQSNITVAVRESSGSEREIKVDPSSWKDRGDLSETAEDYAKRVRERLKVPGGKILLAVAWTTVDEQRLFNCFPEVICADVTLKTNSERRPLFVFAGKDSNFQTFTAFRAFLPSECRWVFNWLWNTVIREFFPSSALERVRLVITDGDENIYGPLENAIARRILPNCFATLCVWHKINRGMHSHRIYCPYKTVRCSIYFDVLELWLWSWTDSIETEAEFDHSLECLWRFIESESVKRIMGEDFISRFRSFLVKIVLPYQDKLLFTTRIGIRGGNERTTSIVEAENSSLKTTCIGPKPNQPIHMSAKCQTEMNERRNKKKARAHAAVMQLIPTAKDHMNIRTELTPKAVEAYLAEWNVHDAYGVYRPEPGMFYVKAKIFQTHSRRPEHKDCFKLYIIPRYERTRVVKVATNREGERHLVCSCKGWERVGIPCRHVWSILKREGCIADVSVRHHKNYAYSYLKCSAFTEFYNSAMRNEPAGVLFSDIDDGKWSTGVCTFDEPDYYTKSLAETGVPLPIPSNYWRPTAEDENEAGESYGRRPQQPDRPVQPAQPNRSILIQETHRSQETYQGDHVGDESVWEGSDCNSSCSSSSSVDRNVAFENWHRRGYSSYQTFSPFMKEFCDSADRSFSAHEYLRRLFLRKLRIINSIEEKDDKIKGRRKGRSQDVHLNDSTTKNNSIGLISSHHEVDKSRKSHRFSANPNSPNNKKKHK